MGGETARRVAPRCPTCNKVGHYAEHATNLMFSSCHSRVAYVVHSIVSTRHSKPSTRILATILILAQVQLIILSILVDGSLCWVLAMPYSTLIYLLVEGAVGCILPNLSFIGHFVKFGATEGYSVK